MKKQASRKLKHLWEIEHDYYCSDTNYFSNECTQNYESWGEFIEDAATEDLDMNLVFRFDWFVPTEDNGEEVEVLKLYYIGQRKGQFRSVLIRVCSDNEPSVREFLELRWKHLSKLWEPFA